MKKRQKKKIKKNKDMPAWLLGLLIVLVVVLIIFSLGLFNPENFRSVPEDFKDSKEEAQRKHTRLKNFIDKQEALKQKLEKRFKRTYFFIRLGLVLIWIATLMLFYFTGFIKNLGDVLNYSEAMILLLVALNFLTFGTISNLGNFIDLIKMKTENWIYGKHISIADKIEINKEELKKLDAVIKQ